jgi:hypothetical protein
MQTYGKVPCEVEDFGAVQRSLLAKGCTGFPVRTRNTCHLCVTVTRPKCSNVCGKGIFDTYVSWLPGLSVQMCVAKEYLSLMCHGYQA